MLFCLEIDQESVNSEMRPYLSSAGCHFIQKTFAPLAMIHQLQAITQNTQRKSSASHTA